MNEGEAARIEGAAIVARRHDPPVPPEQHVVVFHVVELSPTIRAERDALLEGSEVCDVAAGQAADFPSRSLVGLQTALRLYDTDADWRRRYDAALAELKGTTP